MADWQGREAGGATYPPMRKARTFVPLLAGAAIAGFIYILATGKGKHSIVPTLDNAKVDESEVKDQGPYDTKKEGQTKNAAFDHIQRWKDMSQTSCTKRRYTPASN